MDVLRFLLCLPFKLLRAMGRIFIQCLHLIGLLLRPLIGDIRWSTPQWSHFVSRQLQRVENGISSYPKTIFSLLILLVGATVGGYYGYHSYLNRPVPIEVAPLVIQNVDVRLQKPDTINYHRDISASQYIILHFSRSAAPITQIDQDVTEGITITPAIEGEWHWQNDRTLIFSAKKALPMGEEFTVKLDDKPLLAPQIKLKENKYTFATTPFSYSLNQSEFYQDPQSPLKKHAIFTISFNAPVNVQSFEKSLELRTSDNKKLKYTVNYDNKKLNAWVHSESLSPKDISSQVTLNIAKGVGSNVAGNPTEESESYDVTIPSLYSLNIAEVDSYLIESDDGKDARALIVAFNDVVNEKELATGVKVWLLPELNPEAPEQSDENSNYPWRRDEVSEPILARSEILKIRMNDNEQENQSIFSFKYNAPANRYLLVKIPSGIVSVGGYQLKSDDYRIINVPDYPRMLNFMSEGALLSMKGEKQITVAARNLPGLQLDIKRVIPSQLQHIVSFKDRTFTSVAFNRLNDQYFTEHFNYQVALNSEKQGEIQYKGIDLSRYLAKDANAKRGIFLLSLRQWDPARELQKSDTSDAEAYYEGEYEDDDEDLFDSRFVVVTDLGIIAKSSIDGSRDVFVQSIYSGEAVSGATVSVVARNGTKLFSKVTEADGHVVFPPLDDFHSEQTALLFLVEKEGDISFLPTTTYYDRQLDFSRFDIYGDDTPRDPRTLNSYLFSDRGVYRPGETFNIGLITRTFDWKTSVEGIPLRVEVRDPRDTLMLNQPLTLNNIGFNELSYTTSENSPTGEWSIDLYLLGKDNKDASLLGSTSVNVKEFEPDSLKVTLNLTPNRQQGWVKPDELKVNIDVQNLFGTPAQNRRVESKLTLRPVYPNFSRYADYLFYENRRSSDSFESELEERTTDDNGNAEIDLGLDSYADATYQLQLLSEAFEAGSGRSVTAAARVMVSPHDYLVGVKADGSLDYINQKAERTLNLIAIDPTLKPITQQALKVELLEQKYVSVLTRQDSGVYKYQSKLKEVVLSEMPLAIDEKGTDFKLDTQKPGNFVLLVKNADNKVLNRVNYVISGNANVTRSLDRNAELKLTLNKETYKPGEEIEISINAPYTGSGIITIERDKVYHWEWFQARTTNSVQKIRVPADLQGNGYVNVQFIRDINSDEIFMSPLSFGIQPFKVSREAYQAKITLESPDVIKPGETLSIKVNTDSPQKMVVFAVDEGILQVARYRLADPLDYFFRKRALEVNTTQILDLILPEFSKMMSLTAAPGGDAGEGIDLHLNPFKRKKDQPVAYWSGITDVNGEAIFNYEVPDYFNGKLRVMAVSVTPNQIGHSQRYTDVRDDFVLTPNIPTTVAPGDEFDVTLGIANNLTDLKGEKSILDIAITPESQLEIVGSKNYQLPLGEKQETVVSFRLKAQESLGNASIVFTAKSGDKSTVRTVNLSIRPASSYRTRSNMGRMDGKQQSVTDIRQMYDHYAKRDARVSYSPLVLSNALAQYLADYPYNCSEQITSQAVPLLFQQSNPAMKSNYSQGEIDKKLNQTMASLLTRQNGQGAIGEWRSTPETNPFITLYVVQFLLEAQEANYPISATLLTSANGYLQKLAANSALNSQNELRMRAFAVYLLTRQGQITTGSLADIQTRMQNNYPQSWQTDIGALYLAASYKMLKMDEQANTLLKPTWEALNAAYNKTWWTQNYLDPLVQDSTRLYLIVRHFPETVSAIPAQLLENMVLQFKEQRYTTQSSAMSILALEYYSKHIQSKLPQKGELTISATTGDLPSKLISVMKDITAIGRFESGVKEIRFDNPTDKPAWYVVTQSGFDRYPPKEAIARGVEISRDYVNEKGEVVNSVTLGEKLYVHIKIRANAKQGVDDLVIVDLLPGGFEVVQQSMKDADDPDAQWQSPKAATGSLWSPSYSDIREDRVIIYGRATSEIQEFVYQIKATNSGVFSIPAVFGEAMYDREIQAVSAGSGMMTVTIPANN